MQPGAYGLPKLPGGSSFRLYDDFDEEYVFEYPRSWVGRSNSQRAGVYVSDFNVRALNPAHPRMLAWCLMDRLPQTPHVCDRVSSCLGAGLASPLRECMHGRAPAASVRPHNGTTWCWTAAQRMTFMWCVSVVGATGQPEQGCPSLAKRSWELL